MSAQDVLDEGARQPAVVLLAEDNPADQLATRRLLVEGGIRCDLRIVSDGQLAMDYLLRRGEFADPTLSPTPAFIILDVNMPKINGMDVLKKLREIDNFSDTPVAMLTTSDDVRDVLDCVTVGCSAFLEKPLTADKLLEAIREPHGHLELLLTRPPDASQSTPGLSSL